MKKCFSVVLTTIMLFIVLSSRPAYAISIYSDVQSNNSNFTEEVVSPRGSLSGYGQHWYNSGEPTTGTFIVPVTGISWPTAQLTLSLANFSSDVCVQVIVYRPDGSIAFNTADTSGTYLTMANSSQWHNIHFANGKTGNYTVWYSIWSWTGSTPSSGRINCWIY